MKKREIFRYEIPTLPFFYSQNMYGPSLKYRGERLLGEWVLCFDRKNISSAVADTNSFIKSGEQYLSWLINGDNEFIGYLKSLSEKLIELANRFEKLSYEDHKNNTVSGLDLFYDDYANTFVPAFSIGYSLDFALDEYIKKNKIDTSKIQQVGKSFILKEKIDLKRVFESDPEKMHANLLEHSLKYNWLLNNYAGEHSPSILYFENRKNEVLSFVEPMIYEVKDPKSIIEWISFLTYIRDERKKLNLVVIGLMDRFLKKWCLENSVEYDVAVMHTVDEIKKYNGSFEFEVGDVRYMKSDFKGPADIKKEEFDGFADEKLVFDGELFGSIASKGNAKGKAKIVMSQKDFWKVEKGDVIVASMTRPEFAPILERCSAIVTNEGGITCHAAIISRELNVPCLIGTKNATKVFKDGDYIEVDAEKGIVKIIKSK